MLFLSFFFVYFCRQNTSRNGKQKQKAFRMLLAFLLKNSLLEDKRLVFITDGATNTKDHIARFFGFRQYTLLLDWLYLKKKYKEYLSMALKGGKDEKIPVRNALLGMLWVCATPATLWRRQTTSALQKDRSTTACPGRPMAVPPSP